MKSLLVFIAFVSPVYCFTQFGFERYNDIDVIKENIVQKYAWVGGLDLAQYSNIDLNKDGVQDLFIFDRKSNRPLTFIQNGSNGQIDFEYKPQYESKFPDMSEWALLADYDGDGKKDIFTSTQWGVSVFKNTTPITNELEFTLESPLLPAVYEFDSTTLNTFISVMSSDIPAITDVDDDGDLDILAFYFSGPCVRYYKNMSQELYGNSNALEFNCVNVCYGNFTEDNASNVNLHTCCLQYIQVANPESGNIGRPGQQILDRDAGSTLLSIDLDADGMEDLVMGDVSTSNLISLTNGGSSPNTNVDMISPDFAFPSYDTPADITLFPASFYVDLNNDNIRDLMVAPNSKLVANNYCANWMYLNDGVDNNPDFSIQTKGFLQKEMIDVGSHSYPVFFDHNGDGLKDLIVAVGGRYDTISTNNYSQLFYYENTGTVALPEFTLKDNDYENLSNFDNRLHYFYRPAFGDADGDGDEDMLLADITDTMYYFENISSQGNVAQFNAAVPLKDVSNQIIQEGAEVTPKFVDLDRDGKLDLVFGKKNGRLSYYKNVGGGAVNAYNFELVTDTLGGVDVSDAWSTEGTAVPEFVDIDNQYYLICGAKNGYLHYYNNIDGNWNGTFNLVTPSLHDINIGDYSAPLVSDINNDNRLEMFLGNIRGGLACFQSANITNVNLNDYRLLNKVSIYPNPTENDFFVDLTQLNIGSFQTVKYLVTDVSGRVIQNGNLKKTKTRIDCKNFTKGVYFLSVNVDGQLLSRKIVIN